MLKMSGRFPNQESSVHGRIHSGVDGYHADGGESDTDKEAVIT